jgi:hypothetical protein
VYTGFETDFDNDNAAAVFSAKVFLTACAIKKKDQADHSEDKIGQILENSILLDTGANVSLVTSRDRLTCVQTDKTIQIFGCTGKKETSISGLSKEFNKPAVLVEGLTFDIVSLAQLEEDYTITYLKKLFIVSDPKSKIFYLFKENGGFYVAYHRYDARDMSIEQTIQHVRQKDQTTYEDNHMTDRDDISQRIYSLQSDMTYARQQSLARGYSNALLEQIEQIRQVHLVLGHPGEPAMRRLIDHINERVLTNKANERSCERFRTEFSSKGIEAYFQIFKECTTCAIAKMTKSENHWRSTTPVDKPGHAHVDWLFYSLRVKRCFLTVIDEFSKFAMVVHMDRKTANNAHLAMTFVQAYFFQHGHKLTCIYSDRDPSFSNKAFGPLQLMVNNRTPGAHDNEVERFGRTLQNICHAIRADMDYPMPDIMSGKLIKWGCCVYNFRVGADLKSPYGIFHNNRQFSLEHLLHHFGEIVVSAKSHRKNKTDDKSEVGIVVGMDPNSDSALEVYGILSKTLSYRTKMNKVTVDRDKYIKLISLLDRSEGFEVTMLSDPPKDPTPKEQEFIEIDDEKSKVPDVHPDSIDWKGKKNIYWKIQAVLFWYYRKSGSKKVKDIKMFRVKWKGFILVDGRDDMTAEQLLAANWSSQELKTVPFEREYHQRLSINAISYSFHLNKGDETETPYLSPDFPDEDHFTNSEIMLEKMLFTDNQSITQGLADNPEMATSAMTAEMQQILDFKTMSYKKKEEMTPQQIKETLPSFMFLKNKFGEGNVLTSKKARWVAGGNMQDISSIDPERIASTTLRSASYNVLLNVVACKDIDLTILDVKSAYLHVSLPPDLDIHVKIDRHVVKILRKLDSSIEPFIDSNGEVYAKLHKALYGLVQSAKLWYEDLCRTFAQIQYFPCSYNIDPNMFTKDLGENIQPALAGVHVDDIAVGADKIETKIVIDHLTKTYGQLKIQDGDNCSWLGIQITRNRQEKSITLSQSDYIERCIAKFSRLLDTEKFTEEVVPCRVDLFVCNDDHKRADINMLLISIVMSIAFIAHRTRPDLKTVVAYFTTRLLHHDPDDMVALKKLIGYIIHTKDKTLKLSPKQLRILCMADAAYGNHFDRKSHTAILIMLDFDEKSKNITGLVHGHSGKQGHVAQSTAESEVYAQAEALKYLLWLKHLLQEMGVKLSDDKIVFYQDNQAAIRMAQKGSGTFKYTKHVEHRFFLIKDHILKDNIVMVFLDSDSMVADLLTKTTIRGAKLKQLTGRILNDDSVDGSSSL